VTLDYQQGQAPAFIATLPSRRDVMRSLAQDSLYEFIKQAWKHIDPQPFVDGWVLQAVAEHLQAVSEGQIRNLLINIPPRCAKSLTTCVFWPAWEWIRDPSMTILSCSYSQEFAKRDCVKTRDLINTPWYQERWGDRFAFSEDQNQKMRYTNSEHGHRIAFAVRGATGEGGRRLIVDDPLKIEDWDNPTALAENIDWWTGTMATRANDWANTSRVICMQRLAQGDLSGFVLENQPGRYTHLKLPMRFDPGDRCVTVTVGGKTWEDPRGPVVDAIEAAEEAGEDPPAAPLDPELLWVERFPDEAVKEIEADLGPSRSAGQLGQRPTPAGGGKLKPGWFKLIDQAPAHPQYIVRRWDFAATERKRKGKQPDYTASGLISYLNGNWFILIDQHFQESPREVDFRLVQTAAIDGPGVPIRIPQDPGSAGKSDADHKVAILLAGYDAKALPETGDKEQRAGPLASAAEANNVYLVRTLHARAFLDEAELFPFGVNDDMIDVAANGMADIRTMIIEAKKKQKFRPAYGGSPRLGVGYRPR
jgi:predicted phage terminase large subunit-like protein